MNKMKKCIICGINKAEVPDRSYQGIGRPIKKVCGKCHGERLKEDMQMILEIHKRRNKNV